MRPLSLIVLALLACGPADSGEGGVHFELLVQGALVDTIGEFQVAMLKDGRSRSCTAFVGQCLNAQGLPRADYVNLYDTAGKAHPAILFPETPAASSGQQLRVEAEVGRDYLVFVEALSRSTPPELVGTSCTPLGSVSQAGTAMVANAMTVYSPLVGCDPRFEP